MKKNIDSFEEVKNILFHSICANTPKTFIPQLMNSSVLTNMPNKTRFYQFFKCQLYCAHKSKKGDLKLKMEPIAFEGGNELCYSFYDNFHRGPRLSIIIKEENNLIKLTTLPF